MSLALRLNTPQAFARFENAKFAPEKLGNGAKPASALSMIIAPERSAPTKEALVASLNANSAPLRFAPAKLVPARFVCKKLA